MARKIIIPDMAAELFAEGMKNAIRDGLTGKAIVEYALRQCAPAILMANK